MLGLALGGCGDAGSDAPVNRDTVASAPEPGSSGTVSSDMPTGSTPSATSPEPGPSPPSSASPGSGGALEPGEPTGSNPVDGVGGNGIGGTSGMSPNGMGGTGDMSPPAGGASGMGPGSSGSGGSDSGGMGSGGMTPSAGGSAGDTSHPGGGGSPPTDDETFGPDIDGPCTASQPASANASGSGPYDVIIETNSDPGINEGTIFRPAALGGDELFPIFVWGEGGCSQNGLSNQAAMAEIASHGYFVVADGTPNGNSSRNLNSNDVVSMGEPLLAYVAWAIDENSKPCSAYYHSLNASKVAANGFSCGGLMATGTAGDPRITTWGSTSSGTFSEDQALYQSVHTPVLIVEGGPSDIAYENGLRDYDNISALGHPIMFFSKDIGHGGDLSQGGNGDFTKINLAWLNWWLKGDETESGKGVLVGASCTYCSDSEWEVDSANLP